MFSSKSIAFVLCIACGGLAAGMSLAEQASLDLRHFFRFDTDQPGKGPAGFTAFTVGEGPAGAWIVEADPQAPTSPNRLSQSTACPTTAVQERPGCLQLLLLDGLTYEYPDLTVRLRAASKNPQGGETGQSGPTQAGLVFGATKDARTFYAAIVDLTTGMLDVVRVTDGKIMSIGHETVKRKPVPWHTLRLQHNTILSKDFLEISFDGNIVFTHSDKKLGTGQIGLMTRGEAPVWFDNFDAVQLFSQRLLSPPAAY